jgi:hypothetical protein
MYCDRELTVASLLQTAAERTAERDYYKQIADDKIREAMDKEGTQRFRQIRVGLFRRM